jgi:hypothetical protein
MTSFQMEYHLFSGNNIFSEAQEGFPSAASGNISGATPGQQPAFEKRIN